MDIDAAGGAATAGLIGGAIEKPAGRAGEAHHGVCTDCGEPVGGNFCANCGQPTHVHRTLLHLVEEVLHGVIHFDGRIWRTLPLLMLNPGRLTREWIEGRRTRYVSPLAMFLFTVFLMFFAFSLGGGGDSRVSASVNVDEQIAAKEAELADARRELADARASLDAPAAAAARTYTDAAERAVVSTLEEDLTRLRRAKAGGQTTLYTQEGWQGRLAERARSGELDIDTGSKALDKILLKKALNPELALYKIQQTAYKFSFLLVPLSIPFVALLFLWRRGSTFYDHGVFVLYSLTAMSILFTCAMLLGQLWSPLGALMALVLVFGPPAHMFAQLKGAYGLSIFSALWRTVALLVFAAVASLLFLAAIVSLGFTG